MVRLVLLGSAATLADQDHDSIYLLVQSAGGDYLIDCGGSPVQRLAKAGRDLAQLRGILLTHDHADHIYGLPLLVQALMLSERAGNWSGELTIWGLGETLNTAQALLDLFGLTTKIAIIWRQIAPEPDHLVLETNDLTITTSPVEHMRPTIGVRITARDNGRVLAYTSDTSPCPGVTQLARGADILLHEAAVSEPMHGHSTPTQAGQAAATAGVKQLVLVHHDPTCDESMVITEAAKEFGGRISRGKDWQSFDL